MIQIIILDFDGIILESVSVKTEAFRTLFSDYTNYIDEIVQFHINNGGMSRFDKFHFIYNNILKEDLTQKKFEELSEHFATLVFIEVIKSPFVLGAHEFLENYHSKIPLYVVSATPEKELIMIIQKRGLTHYFKNVFGAPRKKADCITEIVKFAGKPIESVIFVGDAKNDFDAAHAAGVRFIGRIKKGDENRFAKLSGVDTVISDLDELSWYLEAHS